jgi:hypothetical protein
MSATNAGQVAVAAGCSQGVRATGGRSSRVVLSPRRWGQVSRSREATGANKPGTPGRSRSSRKTIAQGKPGCPGCTCSPCPCASAHGMPVRFGARDLRVHSAPGFPCALRLFRGTRLFAKLGRYESRECGVTPSDVMARAGGPSSIPEASRLSTAVSGILDRPIKSGDDTEYAV